MGVVIQVLKAHPLGGIVRLAHTPRRFAQRWLAPRTAIPGLWLAGADVSSCGLVGAMMSGYLTASATLGKNLIAAAQRG